MADENDLILLTSNEYIGERNYCGVADAYFVVISVKSFEAEWKAFKSACLENFVKPHIVFLTPFVEQPTHTSPFLFHYGLMLGYSEESMRVYG